jgi:hypothetical protein
LEFIRNSSLPIVMRIVTRIVAGRTGPQPHGTVERWTVELAEVLVTAGIDFAAEFNSGALIPDAIELEVFSLERLVAIAVNHARLTGSVVLISHAAIHDSGLVLALQLRC